MGVTGLMNGLDNVINGGSETKQVSYDDSSGYVLKRPQVIYGKFPSFQTRELTPDFVPHAKGFIGKRTRNSAF